LKKILVTGYNGFIGTHLVDSLKTKFKLIGISEKSTKKADILTIKKDIRKITIHDIPKNIFCIVHLAALTDILYCQKHPVRCFDINVHGTKNILEIARKINSRFLLVSTSHVYGNPQKLPITENHPTNPTSIYGLSKLTAEIITKSYSSYYGLNAAILRLFSVYGPKSPEHLVTSKIILQSLRGKTLSLGNLSSKRDFVYVSDVVDAIELVIKKMRGFNVYNVGTGKSHSILEVCNIIGKINKKKLSIKSKKSLVRSSDIKNMVASKSKIQKLGWRPQTNLMKGLKLTYDWHDSQTS